MLSKSQYAVIAGILAFAPPSIGAERSEPAKVSGIVRDESGKPLAGVACWISAIEEWGDGKWELVFHSGRPREYLTDESGRFEIEFHGKARYDLQFYRWGYGPTFLFQVSADSGDLDVKMEKGSVVRGEIEIKGKEKSDFEAIIVYLRLPNPRGLWFKRSTLVGLDGTFEFYASVPPLVPGQETRSKWQLVCAGETFTLDVEKHRPVDEVVFEIATRVRTKSSEVAQRKVQPSRRPD